MDDREHPRHRILRYDGAIPVPLTGVSSDDLFYRSGRCRRRSYGRARHDGPSPVATARPARRRTSCKPSLTRAAAPGAGRSARRSRRPSRRRSRSSYRRADGRRNRSRCRPASRRSKCRPSRTRNCPRSRHRQPSGDPVRRLLGDRSRPASAPARRIRCPTAGVGGNMDLSGPSAPIARFIRGPVPAPARPCPSRSARPWPARMQFGRDSTDLASSAHAAPAPGRGR